MEPEKENLRKIAEALSLIFDVQLQIYKKEPSLEPEDLKRTSPFPPGLNRKFGEIVIKDSELCDLKQYQEAISLYVSFIKDNPPEFFSKMAKDRIAKIKKDYGV